MTTFAIEQRPQHNIFAAPLWADIVARGCLVMIAVYHWLTQYQPKAEVYLMTRFDLARRYIGPIPHAHWRLGYAFAGMVFVVLWQELFFCLADFWGRYV